ncbi:MAG: hypothetical protein A2792_03605 [Sphingomonadales bacterium RIFCSPHIGHO2_01_FULL_65_20]|nr:MAG: hypothetical protein A2792_03605 [Sphingomonadales bacterium RIFCSPHIGHO2_01_FULL_65_20]
MNEARSQLAQGRVVSDTISSTSVTSGIVDARERLARLNSLLVEIQNHLEDQVSRISGPFPLREDGPPTCTPYSGALGDLHGIIDVLFATAERIGLPASRLDQV